MATSAANIKTAILGHLENIGFVTDNEFSWMDKFVEALSQGIYDELQNLDDTVGTPPSTGHV